MSLGVWLCLESAVHRLADCVVVPVVRAVATWANGVRDAD